MSTNSTADPSEYCARIERRLQYVLSRACPALEILGLEGIAVPGVAWRHCVQFREDWLKLVPDDPAIRSAVELSLVQKYGNEPEWAARTPFEVALDAIGWISAKGGDLIVQEGDPGDFVFLLISGQLAVELPYSSRSAHISNMISAGELVGEIELVTRGPYRASLRSLRDSELIRIPREVVETLAETNAKLWKRIAKSAICHLDRLISDKGEARPKKLAIAVVPAGKCSVPGVFLEHFVNSLKQFGSAGWLSSGAVDSHLGSGASQASVLYQDERLRLFLERHAEEHQYVLYQCDDTLSQWTLRCLRQADRLLFVAESSADPALNEIELYTSAQGSDLVLLRDKDTGTPRTAQWVSRRQPRLTHHVNLANPQDLARVSRFLTGRAFGLVLGGGGSRGLAHIGAIRAFHEAGIDIDMVGGTSMGACIGAQCALGWDWRKMRESCREAFVRRKPLRDYTVPRVSLLSARRLSSALGWLFDDHRIEDLPLSYFAISSDLITGQCVVHKDGLVRRASRASMSVAGILPPVPDGDRLLVDGGILNNLPVDVMSSLVPDVTIAAVDVNPYGFHAFTNCYDYGDSLGSVKLLGSFLRRGKRVKFPGIHAILERTTMLNGIRRAQELLPQTGLYIHPPTDTLGFFDVGRIDEIVDIGYRFARADIENWLETGRP